MKITIVRHGKTTPMDHGWITAPGMKHWIDAYNTCRIANNSRPSDALIEIANNTSSAIVCSRLRRSVDSAKLLNEDRIVLQCDLFSEAQLPYANRGFLKLPPKVWAALFRLYWLLGYSNNSESQTQAQIRANEAAEKLRQLADSHKNILYVGHGIFNRLVVKELLNTGWQGSRNPSGAHWGFNLYHHPAPEQ